MVHVSEAQLDEIVAHVRKAIRDRVNNGQNVITFEVTLRTFLFQIVDNGHRDKYQQQLDEVSRG